MNDKEIVSIIVPVYMVEKYLSKCIDSIISQTLTNIEIILVNDGSTDNSKSICESYRLKDNRIKVLNKVNGGLMSAWKAGVGIATGNYIGFVDSDDWINNDMFERLYCKAKKYDADIVCCEFVRVYKERKVKNQMRLKEGLYEKSDIKKVIYPKLINDGSLLGRGISPNRVTKLFKSSIVKKNLKYCDENVSFGEDMHLTFPAMCDANKIYIIENYYPYNYRANIESITGKYSYNMFQKVKLLNDNLYKISKEKNVYDFGNQIKRDLISLIYSVICNEFKEGNNITFLQKTKNIKIIIGDLKVREAVNQRDIGIKETKLKIIQLLIKYRLNLTGGFLVYIYNKFNMKSMN